MYNKLTDNKEYDAIIIGAGAAGTQLLVAWSKHKNKQTPLRVCIVDHRLISGASRSAMTQSFPLQNRSGRYDSRKGFPFSCHHHSRDTLEIGYDGTYQTLSIQPYEYATISNHDWYAYIQECCDLLIKHGWHIDYYTDTVDTVQSQTVYLKGGETLSAPHIYDSRPSAVSAKHDSCQLTQSFVGSILRVNHSMNAPRFMDFCYSEENIFVFVYVIPMGTTKALVEVTTFGNNTIKNNGIALQDEQRYRDRIERYANTLWGSWERGNMEYGTIPMVVRYPENSSHGHIPIGTPANTLKASTGYSFWRSWKHIQALVKGQHMSYPLRSRYARYDRIMLRLLSKHPARMQHIFYRLVKHGRHRLFRFLDEKGTLWHDIQLFFGLPWGLFIRQARNMTKKDYGL